MNKKGNVFDALEGMKVIVFLVVSILIVGLFLLTFWDNMGTEAILTGTSGDATNNFVQNWGSNWDFAPMFLFLALIIISSIFAFKIPSDTIFFIVAMFAIPFIGLGIYILGDIAFNFFSDAAFVDITSQMPFTNFFLTGNHPLIAGLIYIFITYIFLYAGKNE